MVVMKQRSKWLLQSATAADEKARLERLALTKEQQAEDAPRATRDYRAAEEAVRLRTEKLRAERLAREATVKGKIPLS